jgi:hypothetical protein
MQNNIYNARVSRVFSFCEGGNSRNSPNRTDLLQEGPTNPG